MKLAPLTWEFEKNKDFFDYKLIHTGQHYDKNMSDVFFEDLNIRKPDYYLGAKWTSHSEQTADVMIKLEKVFLKEQPNLVVVVWDINSTLAAAIVAKKLHFKLAHIEAGLRSFDNEMPEEINRLVTDSISDFFFVTEQSGIDNLKKQWVSEAKIFFVGNLMIDSLVYQIKKMNNVKINDNEKLDSIIWNANNNYVLVTLHRPSNVDIREKLEKIITVLNTLSEKIKIIFPIHPRTRKNIEKYNIHLSPTIHLIDPLWYEKFIYLVRKSKYIITDSWWIQEEASFLEKPTLTLRENTERPVTISLWTNILSNVENFWEDLKSLKKKAVNIPFWDWKTAKRIINTLKTII